MNEPNSRVGEADLHRWVDERLDDADQARVRAALESEPALRALAEHFRQQNEGLRAHWSAVLDEPVPARLVRAARGEGAAEPGRVGAPAAGEGGAGRPAADGLPTHAGGVVGPRGAVSNRPAFRWVASLLAACAVGIALGWVAREQIPRVGSDSLIVAEANPARLTRAAAVAHAAFAPEVRHPVEVGASEQAHLVAWLSKRLGTSLKVPNLEPQGFRLMGGRLLPDEDGGVAAQFMFESGAGQRLTLFVRRDAAGSDTAFRFAERGSLGTFYWLDRGFGYALSGELPRAAMLSVASAVYRQLNP